MRVHPYRPVIGLIRRLHDPVSQHRLLSASREVGRLADCSTGLTPSPASVALCQLAWEHYPTAIISRLTGRGEHVRSRLASAPLSDAGVLGRVRV